jgi:hypothetical protein
MVGSYFSAVCWFTLKRVFDAVRASTGEQVPLGGIDQSYGGTSIQYWMSPDAIKASQAPIATQVVQKERFPYIVPVHSTPFCTLPYPQ